MVPVIVGSNPITRPTFFYNDLQKHRLACAEAVFKTFDSFGREVDCAMCLGDMLVDHRRQVGFLVNAHHLLNRFTGLEDQ